MKTFIKLTGVVTFILLAFLVFRTLWQSGAFKSIEPHETSPLTVVKGMVGAEDITIDRSLRKALVSADDRRGHRAGEPVKGAIYLLDYLADPPVFTDLTAGFDQQDFHPHGISLYHETSDSTKWVFVVNHRDQGHFIEIFQFTDSSLIHRESISDPAICSPNDVAGVGKRQFYFTNDHDQDGGIDRWKDYLLIGTGQAGFYDGEKVEIFDQDLGYANGIHLSMDGQVVYVACTTDKMVVAYDRKSHQRLGQIDCQTGLDNIELDENGNLWIGCHPQMLAFASHAKKASSRSPSQVLKIEPDLTDFSQSKIIEVYLNDGNPLSGSSVAAVDGDLLLLGTVFEDGVGIGSH